MCIIDHGPHAQCFIQIQIYIYKFKKERFWPLDNATELAIYQAHLNHPLVIINNSCALFLSLLLQSSYYSVMILSFIYIKKLDKLHTNVFRLHPSSPNFHSCCYFCSQTLSMSAFLPSFCQCLQYDPRTCYFTWSSHSFSLSPPSNFMDIKVFEGTQTWLAIWKPCSVQWITFNKTFFFIHP